MTDTVVAPEPLSKIVWRVNKKFDQSSVVNIENGQDYNQYQSPSVYSSTGAGENVNIAERYLFEATTASKTEAEENWRRFVRDIEQTHYTESQIKKIIHNLDKKKEYSALHYAVWHNNIIILEKLLDENSKFCSDVHVLNGHGEHVLHIVARSIAIWETEKSKTEEPEVNSPQQTEEQLPIRRTNTSRVEPMAPSSKMPRVLQLLLPLCNRVDYRDNEQRTPLHLATLLNRPAYIKILLHSGADILAKSILQNTVFHYVSLSICSPEDKDKMFNILMKSSKINESFLTTKNLDGLTPLSMAAGNGTANIINSIVAKIDPRLVDNELSVCINMIAKGSNRLPTAILERFLQHYYNPRKSANLLHIICHYDNPELLTYVLEYFETHNKNLNELLKQTDERGYTPLLIAVYFGHKTMVQILIDHKAEYLHVMTHDKKNILHLIAQRQHRHVLEMLIKKLNTTDFLTLMSVQSSQATPLHEICQTNDVSMFQLLLQSCKGDPFMLMEHQNAYGRTIFHEACENGRLEMVKYLTGNELIRDEKKKIELLAIGDYERRTCLHVAAAEGQADVVTHLLKTHLVDIDASTDKHETAFHYACANGHRAVVIELLTYECDTLLRNAQLYNGLELAIVNHHEDVARLLLLPYPHWRRMLQNAQMIFDSAADAYDTPLRKLIRYMPELAADVIDQQFTRTSGSETSNVDKQIYDYEFFEDQLVVKQWYSKVTSSNITEDGVLASCCGCFDYRSEYEAYTNDSYTLVRNHPLFIISESGKTTLMEHEFCQALREKKYSQFGRYLLIFSFLLYLLYLAAYTGIMLSMKHPQYYYALVNETSITNGVCESVANRLISYNITEAYKDKTYKNLRTGVYVMLCFFIAKNLILIVTLFPRIFRKGSYYLEGIALCFALVCVLDVNSWLDSLTLRCPIQYQVGAMALLLSWMNLLIYVRCIPIIGIYVVMLQVISVKFLRFLPVLLVIISGFGFTYYALFQNQDVYATPILSLIKTSVVMFEMNFEERFYKPNAGGISYYPVAYILLILSAYGMTVFVVNLLIGMAVGEIPTLVEQGKLLQSRIYYELLSDYEILRLQIRSLILWIISHIFCCCTSSFKYQLYGLVDRSFLRQRPILFLTHDGNRYGIFARFVRFLNTNVLNEQIQESIDDEVKEQYQKRKNTKQQRALDDQDRETKVVAYLEEKVRQL